MIGHFRRASMGAVGTILALGQRLSAWSLLVNLIAIWPLLGLPAFTGEAWAAELEPPPGSPERKAILDALRVELRRYQDEPMVFVVRHLKVADRWAWVVADPQSADATSYYEPVSALLRKRGGSWTLVEMPCAEEDNPECITNPGYFPRLRARRPDVPPEILPPSE